MEAKLAAMEAMPEHQKMARAAAKLLQRPVRSMATSDWRPKPNTAVGVMRHSGKLEPCVLQDVRDGWAYVTDLDSFQRHRAMGTPRRTFYKGASWLFELPPAQWTRLRKQYPDLDVERG
jgi:hypothetical protein